MSEEKGKAKEKGKTAPPAPGEVTQTATSPAPTKTSESGGEEKLQVNPALDTLEVTIPTGDGGYESYYANQKYDKTDELANAKDLETGKDLFVTV